MAERRGPEGRPEPRGLVHETGRHGESIARRPDGRPRDVRLNGGMNVHHNLNGDRRFEREGPGHSRIVAEHGGRGYVEHSYRYHDREFGRRTYYHDGRVYDRYYGLSITITVSMSTTTRPPTITTRPSMVGQPTIPG